MKSAFGGTYKCSRGHTQNHFFFDSKPEEIACLYCNNGNQKKLIRELDLGQSRGKRLGELRRDQVKSVSIT